MECMRQYISELLDFIADMHTLTKLKVGSAARAVLSGFCSRKLDLVSSLVSRAI